MKKSFITAAAVLAALALPACAVVRSEDEGRKEKETVYVHHDTPTVIEKKTDVHVYEK